MCCASSALYDVISSVPQGSHDIGQAMVSYRSSIEGRLLVEEIAEVNALEVVGGP